MENYIFNNRTLNKFYPMKSTAVFLMLCGLALFISCKKDESGTLGGSQSPIGAIGETVESSFSEISGVSGISGTVTSLSGGVSSFSGSATITNETIKNILSNSSLVTVDGNTVSIEGVKVKFTSEGIESYGPLTRGIISKFDAKVGDTYPCGSGKRTVTSVSTDDDFFWGGMMIKAISVEETPNAFGVKKIVYFSNHKWGLVAVEFTFDDNSVARFPVYSSTSN
jgi:hypothetical protein